MKESIECMVVNLVQEMQNDKEKNREMERVKVRVKMHRDCSSCGLCEGSNAVYYEAINKVNAKCGQSVILEIEKESVLKIAFMVFVLPMLVIAVSSVLGVFIAKDIHASEVLAAIIFSMIALIPTFKLIKKYDAKIQGTSSTPVLTKIVNE